MRSLALTGLFFAVVVAVAVPFGHYLTRVFRGENDRTRRIGGALERLIHRVAGVDATREHTWTQYAIAVLLFSAVTQLLTFLVLRVQHALPFDATGRPGMPAWLAFDTATSFATNTNWQSYAGESTLGDLAQSVALTSQNFFSAAVGICVAIAVMRGLAAKQRDTVGNFWVDLVRVHLYVLLPIATVYAVFLVSQGVVQTYAGPAHWVSLDGITQHFARGPVASQVAIKMLGTNGGGFFNANGAHPWENPNALTNFVQIVSIAAIPAALCITLGDITARPAHGRAVLATMMVIAAVGIFASTHFESAHNPLLASLGIHGPHMEGKEVRFGIVASSLFATITTDASCGAVNAMHDSFSPLGGLVPMLNIQLGEIVFGGVGSGLYGMVVYIVIAVFLAGLMVGRTPEYLGKKLDSRDVRFASLFVLVPALTILVFAAIGVSLDAGRSGMANVAATAVPGAPWRPSSHGFSELLYAYTSAAGNNGSAFAGLTAYSDAHPVFYSLTLALAMFIGRFPLIVGALAIAGNMARKKVVAPGPGSFPVDGPLFVALLTAVIVIVGALTFFPALSLGPIAEHLAMH